MRCASTLSSVPQRGLRYFSRYVSASHSAALSALILIFRVYSHSALARGLRLTRTNRIPLRSLEVDSKVRTSSGVSGLSSCIELVSRHLLLYSRILFGLRRAQYATRRYACICASAKTSCLCCFQRPDDYDQTCRDVTDLHVRAEI